MIGKKFKQIISNVILTRRQHWHNSYTRIGSTYTVYEIYNSGYQNREYCRCRNKAGDSTYNILKASLENPSLFTEQKSNWKNMFM